MPTKTKQRQHPVEKAMGVRRLKNTAIISPDRPTYQKSTKAKTTAQETAQTTPHALVRTK